MEMNFIDSNRDVSRSLSTAIFIQLIRHQTQMLKPEWSLSGSASLEVLRQVPQLQLLQSGGGHEMLQHSVGNDRGIQAAEDFKRRKS